MIKFIIIHSIVFFLCSCSFNFKKNNNVITKGNESSNYSFYSLYNKKHLNSKQISYLKSLIKQDPTLIKKLSTNQVLSLLGNPLVIKKQQFTEIWQYRNSCILNIVWEKNESKDNLKKFLYNSGHLKSNSIDFKIVWLECLDLNGRNISFEACFFELTYIK